MITHEVEVLVAGLGPVGSVGALNLARQGVQVAAIEATTNGATDLRASTFHAPTIEMLDKLGAADVLLEKGLKAPVYQYRDRKSGETFAFDMAEIADRTRFPFRIQCEQHLMSQDVAAKLAEQSTAKVAYGHRLLFVEQDADKVTAYVETPTSVERYVARYLMAADGSNSVTRKVLGLGFPGFTYSEKFLCYSTRYPIEDALSGLEYVNYISDPKEWMVLLRVPNLWRILVPAAEGDDDGMLLSDQNKDEVFHRMLGDKAQVETNHRTIYRVHQRVCESFVQGRIGLVGDAAHLNSPMGGFGMNSGIHDALNLGDKLVDILRRGGDPELLALYDRQRRTVTNSFVQTQTIDNTKAMSEGWASAREGRRAQMLNLAQDPAARREYLLRQAMFTSLEDAAAIQ
ncbi:NAD(P)/FAD-dependent oxidoreductase [Phenylobacterium aquaticum]|uniref:FAD-dependent oxidoreductase n=1 Tax=Phenylobacterium aquaticum TaxID=1763816 RepID=UPI0026EDACD7|nr:FAD-dependent monooxygenase [Phenylobacterium aquaticum]